MTRPFNSSLFSELSPHVASQTKGGHYWGYSDEYDHHSFKFVGQTNLFDLRADLNCNGDVSIGELVRFNRDQRSA